MTADIKETVARLVYFNAPKSESFTGRVIDWDDLPENGIVQCECRNTARDIIDTIVRKAGLLAAIHSQYPIVTEYDRGYGNGRKDAAFMVRTLLGDDYLGFFASLNPEQQASVLEYRGPEDHGDPTFLRSNLA